MVSVKRVYVQDVDTEWNADRKYKVKYKEELVRPIEEPKFRTLKDFTTFKRNKLKKQNDT